MQVKAQADTADSSEAKEHAKSELESLKACPTSCSMSNALTGQPEQSAAPSAVGFMYCCIVS